MKDFSGNFDTNNIKSVELNLLNGQVEITFQAEQVNGKSNNKV